MNVKYEEFRTQLLDVIQNSKLDVGSVYYIFKDVFTEIDILYRQQLRKELAEKEKETEEDTTEETE